MKLVDELTETVGTKAACAALAVPRATVYRHRARRTTARQPRMLRRSPRALSPAERESVLGTLNAPEFADLAVPQVYAQLLDQGRFLCSIRTMYRVLEAEQCVRERRQQLRHPNYTKPELLTPADVHQGRVDARLEVRDRALDAAFTQHPERFVLGPPKAPRPPESAWINPPQRSQDPLPQLPAGAAH